MKLLLASSTIKILHQFWKRKKNKNKKVSKIEERRTEEFLFNFERFTWNIANWSHFDDGVNFFSLVRVQQIWTKSEKESENLYIWIHTTNATKRSTWNVSTTTSSKVNDFFIFCKCSLKVTLVTILFRFAGDYDAFQVLHYYFFRVGPWLVWWVIHACIM